MKQDTDIQEIADLVQNIELNPQNIVNDLEESSQTISPFGSKTNSTVNNNVPVSRQNTSPRIQVTPEPILNNINEQTSSLEYEDEEGSRKFNSEAEECTTLRDTKFQITRDKIIDYEMDESDDESKLVFEIEKNTTFQELKRNRSINLESIENKNSSFVFSEAALKQLKISPPGKGNSPFKKSEEKAENEEKSFGVSQIQSGNQEEVIQAMTPALRMRLSNTSQSTTRNLSPVPEKKYNKPKSDRLFRRVLPPTTKVLDQDTPSDFQLKIQQQDSPCGETPELCNQREQQFNQEARLIFSYIKRMDNRRLKSLLQNLVQLNYFSQGNIVGQTGTTDSGQNGFLDITQLFDRKGFNPLHFAAFQNSAKAVQILCEHVLKYGNGRQFQDDPNYNYQLNKRFLEEWINTQSKCDDSFTAMHFASFFGNFFMIKYLISQGANPYQTNSCDINMLHVAAQGDQPLSIALFLKLGLDINSRDQRMSTPLHWAAFAGADMSLTYILSWGANINLQDIKGLTPLHLAVKTSEDMLTTRTIRALLLKGADPKIRDYRGLTALDYLNDFENHIPEKVELIQDIYALLQDEPKTLLSYINPFHDSDCFSLKTKFRKHQKSKKTLYIYFILMISSFLFLHFCILPASLLASIHLILFIASIFLCFYLSLLDPGFLQKDSQEEDYFLKLLISYDPATLCPECQVLKTPRSRHCYQCGRCVDRFDHHCPWINNCIGANNMKVFYGFIVVQSVYLGITLILVGHYMYTEMMTQNEIFHSYLYQYFLLMFLMTLIFFFFSLMALCFVQTTNLILQLTTNERFSNQRQRYSNTERLIYQKRYERSVKVSDPESQNLGEFISQGKGNSQQNSFMFQSQTPLDLEGGEEYKRMAKTERKRPQKQDEDFYYKV